MEIFKNGVKKNRFKIFKVIFILLICFFIICLIILKSYNFRNSEINSLQKLGDVLRIDLNNDIYALNDIEYNYSYGETELNIYYIITDTTLNDKKYYQFSDKYDPLPSSTENIFGYGIVDFMKKNGINNNEIIYMNSRSSEYEIFTIFGELSVPFDVNIHIIKSQNDDKYFKVILSTSIPYKLRINLSTRDLFFKYTKNEFFYESN